jgi:flagellar hook-associated protein 3 FlgL
MSLARSIDSIAQGREEIARLERQIASGQRWQSLSEAPLDGRAVLSIDGDLRAAEQHSRNIEAARFRLAVEDSTLDVITNTLARARELAVQQGGSLATPASRAAAEQELLRLRDALVQLANRRVNGAFLFGGEYADRPPLDATGSLDATFPARGAADYEIGPGVWAPAVHDAGQMFIDSDVIGAIGALDTALAANDPAAIQASADRLRDSIAQVQVLVTDAGARQVRLDMAQDSQDLVTDGLRARRSVLADASIEEAVTRLVARQASFQASLLATSRTLESSLANYLR